MTNTTESLKADAKQTETLLMLTTTSKPYVFNVPTFLERQVGISYWFRYLRTYIDEPLIALGEKIEKMEGILYFRDDKSPTKLCYPLRRFKVLWVENTPGVWFLNVLLGDIVSYASFAFKDKLPSVLAEVDERSREMLEKDFQTRIASGMPLPLPGNLALPAIGAPALLTEAALRLSKPNAAAPTDSYLWLARKDYFSESRPPATIRSS